ncbi:hypothetical protein OIDMADRAFT_20107 [Oidiodendron maius Zn]|uniref:Uncharacterized protein n=1 Tax=Oidiodendron maius (strain Zn) TaxID=913774 RepID=A0A0C3H7V2_OIDMZ|nr:hypothetical protein OIDMADRAFT_20107 [Oidiodendron maius Zn]
MKPLILVLGLAVALVASLPLNIEGRQDSPDVTALEYGVDESPQVRTPSEWRWLRERQSGIAMGNNELVGLPTA